MGALICMYGDKMFHDRRRKSNVEIPLTKKQREYFDDAKSLSIAAHNQADFLLELDAMRNGDKAIENLEAKARQAIISANPEPCQVCLGAGCGSCVGTGRRLEGA